MVSGGGSTAGVWAVTPAAANAITPVRHFASLPRESRWVSIRRRRYQPKRIPSRSCRSPNAPVTSENPFRLRTEPSGFS